MERAEYTISELIHNPSFRRMAKGTAGEDDIIKWNHWIEESDRNREIAREAMAEIAGFEFKDPVQLNMDEEWHRLSRSTVKKAEPAFTDNGKLSRGSSLKWIYRVAVILLLGGVMGIGLYLYQDGGSSSTQVEQITREQTISTVSGEHKTINFSNGSRIVMNSNTTVTYSLGLLHNQTIDVVLEGEAYFDAVSQTAQPAPVFAVRTPDGTIRDIGTEFLVTVRDGHTRIVLEEGEAVINPKSGSKDNQSIPIQRGEMLEFNSSKFASKKSVNASFYTSWATGSMRFEKTTIREFAGFVEERFDVEVKVVDPELGGIKLDGGIHFMSLEELVRSVSDIAGIPVYQSENRKIVYIGDNPNNINAEL